MHSVHRVVSVQMLSDTNTQACVNHSTTLQPTEALYMC